MGVVKGGKVMKISLLEPLNVSAEEIEELSKTLKDAGHEFVYYNTKTTNVEELKRRSQGQDIVMIANNPYPNEVIRAMDNLKMIAVAFTGIDHVGLDACKERGIEVRNCAGYSNETVAELVIGLTLSIMRKMEDCGTAVRNGGTSAGLIGGEIAGKKVGIIGCGKIGYRTAKLFQAFGADVIAYQRTPDKEVEKEGIRFVELETLLTESDIISLHVPLNASTRGFMNAERIAKLKKDAILINCARGSVVDNEALAEALNAERIAAAGIDVFDMDPPIPADYCLLNAKNVTLTPHVAFLSKESMIRRAKIEFDNVVSYIKGEKKNICTF